MEKVAKLNCPSMARMMRHQRDLDGLASDGGGRIIGCCQEIVACNIVGPFGGESEWCCEFIVDLHLLSQQPE
jgi:hypothetical protein